MVVLWEWYTIQYNFTAKCPYNCTRNVLLQVHLSHIHANRKI